MPPPGAKMTNHIKVGYAHESYIQQTINKHLRKIIGHFGANSHWLHIGIRHHKKKERQNMICHMSAVKVTDTGLPAECDDPV